MTRVKLHLQQGTASNTYGKDEIVLILGCWPSTYGDERCCWCLEQGDTNTVGLGGTPQHQSAISVYWRSRCTQSDCL